MNSSLFPPFFHETSINPSVLKIFSILGISHDNTPAGIVQRGQEILLRKKGQERWEIGSVFEEKRTELLPYLEQLGFVNAVAPMPGLYDYFIIFGFATSDMKNQFDYITPFIQSNTVRGKNVILLTSSLPLPEQFKRYHFGETEAAMMCGLFKQSILSGKPSQCIEVPMIVEHNKMRRPTTQDTIEAWLATRPVPGSCLALSAQPFIRRQSSLLEALLPSSFTMTPAGPEAEHDMPIGLYLDELARALHQEFQI
jgi:hypothetical protein